MKQEDNKLEDIDNQTIKFESKINPRGFEGGEIDIETNQKKSNQLESTIEILHENQKGMDKID